MAKRVRKKKYKQTYRYSCNITGEEFVTTSKAKNPDELISISAYYQINPEEDDRPENIKKRAELHQEELSRQKASETPTEENNKEGTQE